MANRVLLTDARNQILEGEYDKENATHRKRKSRFRESTRTVLSELREIAQNPHIDNSEALPPDQVAALIEALLVPTIEPDGYDDYRKELYFQLRPAFDALHDDQP